jgi:DNA-binding transcriptional LysR family regulator
VTSGLVRKKIAGFPLMKVSAADAPSKRVGRAKWTSLQGAPLVTLPLDNPIQRVIDTQLAKLQISTDDASRVNFFATVIAMVEAGFGSAVIPNFAIAACRRHNVRLDLLEEPQLAVGFYRIARRGAARTDAMAAFDEILAEFIPAMTQ